MIKRALGRLRALGAREASFFFSALLLLGLAALFAVASVDAFVNLWHSVAAFLVSVTRYFYVVFTGDVSGGLSNGPLPYDMMDFTQVATPVSFDFESWKSYMYSGFRVLTNLTFLRLKLSGFAAWAQLFARVLMLLAAMVLPVFLLFKDYFEPNGKPTGYRSRALRGFDWVELHAYRPVRMWLVDFWVYLARNRQVVKAAAALVFYAFNGFSFVIDFFTYYLTFAVSWRAIDVFKGVASGAVLLWPLAVRIGEAGFLVLAYCLFDWLRVRAAVKKLYKLHKKNMDYIGSLGLTVTLVGPPGTGKTMTNSSMARTQEETLRKTLNKIIITFWDAFPDFPWMAFYEECADQISKRVWNSALIDDWAASFYGKFAKDLEAGKPIEEVKGDLFGYDFKERPMTWYDELHVWHLSQAIEICAEAYFLYQFPDPLISSNFPQNEEFEFKKSTAIPSFSYRQYDADFRKTGLLHKTVVNDFNAWRLKNPITPEVDEKTGLFKTGKPDDCKICGCIEGVVYSFQEVNKEWVNRNGDGYAQCSHDGTSTAISIIRHAGTIMNIPMPRVITDSQRMGDSNVGITSKFENELVIADRDKNYKTVLFLWVYTRWLQETLIGFHDWVKDKFVKARKDQTLLITLMDRVNKPIFDRYSKRRNKFQVIRERIIDIHHTSVTTSDASEGVYYILPKDDYSDKYRTDSLKGDICKMKRKRKGKWNQNGLWKELLISDAERKEMNSYSTNKLGIDQ